MKIYTLTGCDSSNRYHHKQTFGQMIIGEQTMERASRLVSPSYAESVQALGKYYRCNLRKILGYDNATPDKKKILDAIFAKMPKEEVDDLTLYCESSNTQMDNSLHRIIDIAVTTKYPEPMSIYSYKKTLRTLNRDESGDFLYNNYIERYNRECLEEIRNDGISMISDRDTTVPLPNQETVYKSIKKIFNDKYLSGTKDNAKISLKLPTKEELNKLLPNNHYDYGIKPEDIDFWVEAIQFAKPTLEHYAQSYNIEIRPGGEYNHTTLDTIIKSKKTDNGFTHKIDVTMYEPGRFSDETPEGAGTRICSNVEHYTGKIEKAEARDRKSY